MPETPQNLPPFKEQPWILFDVVAAKSFLIGDNTTEGRAIGSSNPAITRNGEMIFFNDRNKQSYPHYTNLDVAGQLSYGFEVWQAYVMIKFPAWTNVQSNTEAPDFSPPEIAGPTQKLAECIVYFSILDMELGQENQVQWSTHRFGAGGGISAHGGLEANTMAQNSQPQSMNVMKFPEPIMMGNTQNFGAKIRLAPETFNLIGTRAAPGVGAPLGVYSFDVAGVGEVLEEIVELENLPFAVEFGLVGKRVKLTEYGQVVGPPQR